MIVNEPMNNQVLVSDLALVVTLSLQFPIEKVDAQNPQRIVFSFKDTPKLQNVISNFWKGKVTVDPQKWHAQEKFIKSQIRNHGK